MIKRTTKYVASDDTEHDSPQAAAQRSLETAMACMDGAGPWEAAGPTILALARNPEALRDAVNAYFEDLEAHPDLPTGVLKDGDIVRQGSFTVPQEPPHPSGLILTENAKSLCQTATLYDWLAQGWSPKDLIQKGMAVKIAGTAGDSLDSDRLDVKVSGGTDELEREIAPGVRGFEMEVPKGSYFAVDYASGSDWSAGATVHKYRPTPLGNPDDPTTWRADLPVDHPNYCRPFGTKED